jgi:hypothetical protein
MVGYPITDNKSTRESEFAFLGLIGKRPLLRLPRNPVLALIDDYGKGGEVIDDWCVF